MPKTISPELEAHIGQSVTTLAACWRIVRTDGKEFFFTDHDRPLTFGGDTYISSSGFLRSAISNSATTNNSNVEVKGFMESDSIREDELRNGAFDYAEVYIFYVNWMDLTQGDVKLRYGRFGEATWTSSGFFAVELRGIMDLLTQTIGETFSPECRADLGDERCKVVLQPAVRQVFKEYNVGDRVLVSQAPEMSIAPFILNNGFEIFAHTSLYGNATYDFVDREWAISNIYFYNFDRETNLPMAWYAQTDGESGSLSLIVTDATIADSLSSMVTSYRIFSGPTHQIRVTQTVYNNTDVVEQSQTPWTSQLDDAEYTLATATGSHDPVDYTHVEFLVEYRNDPLETPSDVDIIFNIEPSVGGDVLSHTDFEPYEVSFPVNPDLRLIGWEYDNATLKTDNIRLNPATGERYIRLSLLPSDPIGYMRMTIDFDDNPDIDILLVDAGEANFEVTWLLATEESGTSIVLRAEFYDATDTLLDTKDKKAFYIRSKNLWSNNSFKEEIPMGTRSIRFSVIGTCTNDYVRSMLAIDSGLVRIYDRAFEVTDNYHRFGGVEYLCTTAGETEIVNPSFSTVIGATEADGTVVWEVVEPLYTFIDEIGTGFDHSTFTLPQIDVADADLTMGVIRFLTGENAGKAMEIKSWNNTSKVAVTALPVPFVPQTGDEIMVHVGCDKRRGTCNDRFDNILNFRGEPDLPGTDEFFKVAGTGVSAAGSGKKGGMK